MGIVLIETARYEVLLKGIEPFFSSPNEFRQTERFISNTKLLVGTPVSGVESQSRLVEFSSCCLPIHQGFVVLRLSSCEPPINQTIALLLQPTDSSRIRGNHTKHILRQACVQNKTYGPDVVQEESLCREGLWLARRTPCAYEYMRKEPRVTVRLAFVVRVELLNELAIDHRAWQGHGMPWRDKTMGAVMRLR